MNTYTADYSSSLFIMKNWVISNIATYQNHLKEILQPGNLQMSMYHLLPKGTHNYHSS